MAILIFIGALIVVGCLVAWLNSISTTSGTSYESSSTQNTGYRPSRQPDNYRRAEYDPEKYCYMKDGISGERCLFCYNCEHSERGTRAYCKKFNLDVNDNCVCDLFEDEMATLIVSTMNQGNSKS